MKELELLESKIKERIESEGFPVRINTKFCADYREDEKNTSCNECESVKGCGAFIEMMQIVALTIIKPPESIIEVIALREYVNDKLEELLKKEDKTAVFEQLQLFEDREEE